MSETTGASGRAEAESPRRRVDKGCDVGWHQGRAPDASAPRGDAEKQAQRRDWGRLLRDSQADRRVPRKMLSPSGGSAREAVISESHRELAAGLGWEALRPRRRLALHPPLPWGETGRQPSEGAGM